MIADDLPYAELLAHIRQAAGLLHLTAHDAPAAWHNLDAGQPGLRSTTADYTPPEDFERILDDPAYKALAELRKRAKAALVEVMAVRVIVGEWATGDTPPLTPVNVDLSMWCDNCLGVGQCSPRHRGVLCRWCYDFNAVEKFRPPPHLVEWHHQSRTITQAMVAAARPKKKPKGSKKGRKATA